MLAVAPQGSWRQSRDSGRPVLGFTGIELFGPFKWVWERVSRRFRTAPGITWWEHRESGERRGSSQTFMIATDRRRAPVRLTVVFSARPRRVKEVGRGQPDYPVRRKAAGIRILDRPWEPDRVIGLHVWSESGEPLDIKNIREG